MYSSDKLISVKEAGELISKYLKPVEDDETVPLAEAYGRICSHDIYSRMDNPPFDRSEVDGFAVRISDLATGNNGTNRLKIGGKVLIGTDPSTEYDRGVCVQISTGSVVPGGFDAVYRIEDVAVEGGYVIFSGKPPKFDNIAKAGSDVLAGDLVLRKFKMITEKEMGTLTILGVEKVRVFRRIGIGIIASGNELVRPGSELRPGQSYEGNSSFIKAILGKYSVFLPKLYGTVPDNEAETAKVLEKAFTENLVVITTGGSSAGEMDYIGKIAASYSPGIIFHGIDMKPGKPTFFALNGKRFMIGLPGFPVSAFISFTEIFLEKLLEMAHYPLVITEMEAQLALGTRIKKGSTNYIPAIINRSDNLYAFPLAGESGSLSRILRSDAILTINTGKECLNAGESATIHYFNEEPGFTSGVLAGDVDPFMDTIFSISGSFFSSCRTSHEEGLKCLENGSANLMGVRVKSGTKPFAGKKRSYRFFRIFSSDLGIVFRKGENDVFNDIKNRKGVALGIPAVGTYPAELIRSCLAASGFDAGPDSSGVEYPDLRGIALAVRNGRIPAGIGNGETASRYNLDFRPAAIEEYYVAVSDENLQDFQDILNRIGNEGLRILKEYYRSYNINADLFTGRIFSSGIS